MTQAKRYSKEQVAGFDAHFAPFRGHMKVQPNGTIYFAKDGSIIDTPNALPLLYAYQTCVFDLATTFLGHCTGKFRDIRTKYDMKDTLDENKCLVQEYHVRLYGAHMSLPIESDLRHVFAEAHSAISFEDALIRLALLYQAAIDSWVGFWVGPKEAVDWFQGQLARHDQFIVLPALRIPQSLPVEGSAVVTSGKKNAADAMPIDDSIIDPRLLTQNLPAEERVAVSSSNEVAAPGLIMPDFFIDPALSNDWS
ncbi:hypothetical protein PMIN01_00457 [Paraphaeosphaeria minitans]|uniref:Uncharacterized protein n=1 Tax=Paraphaeosphaeria minitans TaxID=565426 RepID=A0A9P6KVF7_9PLEO|nr:hypothetical protein PMIN01_00457 [Paraphaeosphaeria minitans]